MSFIPEMSTGSGKYLRMGDLKNLPNKSATFRFITPVFKGLEMWTEANKPVGRLPSDIALRVTRLYAEVANKYAADEKLFLDDFALTFEKLLALGASGVGVQGGNWRWKGFNGTWEGYGKDAAINQLK